MPKFYQWNFEDDNYVEGQSTVKTTKIESLENWYTYIWHVSTLPATATEVNLEVVAGSLRLIRDLMTGAFKSFQL